MISRHFYGDYSTNQYFYVGFGLLFLYVVYFIPMIITISQHFHSYYLTNRYVHALLPPTLLVLSLLCLNFCFTLCCYVFATVIMISQHFYCDYSTNRYFMCYVRCNRLTLENTINSIGVIITCHSL